MASADPRFANIRKYTNVSTTEDNINDLFKLSFAYDVAEKIREDGYLRTQLTSQLVGSFIGGVSCEYNKDVPALSRVCLDENIQMQIEILKYYTYESHIEGARLKTVEFKGKEIVRSIFNFLKNDFRHELLPEDWRNRCEGILDEGFRLRCLSDFVASMTDRYAIEFHKKLSPGDSGTIFKTYF